MFLRLELGDGEEERIKKGKGRGREGKQGEERMTKEEEQKRKMTMMSYSGHTCTKKLFIVHQKFKYNWVPCILYGNPNHVPGKRLSISMYNLI